MNSSSSGGRLENFLAGKGFYIVLFLCAAVIGTSAWMMASGKRAMDEDVTAVMGEKISETVVYPSTEEANAKTQPEEIEPAEPEINTDGIAQPGETEALTVSVTAPYYVWPAAGNIERSYARDKLIYDETMGDWRTHRGIDIASDMGSEVTAVRGGTVESVMQDDFYGTVVTVDHGDGVKSVYANLDAQTCVSAGNWVDAGGMIGYIGQSALCEVGQTPHLHFEMTAAGIYADPMYYLPG